MTHHLQPFSWAQALTATTQTGQTFPAAVQSLQVPLSPQYWNYTSTQAKSIIPREQEWAVPGVADQ